MKQKQQDRILGGEITLWAENVKYDTLELRMWPRCYVIAERLWSDASITRIEDSMYQRLETMDDWSTLSVGITTSME
ncbi:family 20 glycosylhydrolase [Photobacterium leiognathi]|uniref:family 20 glycosylhydrolase n=1 Tax=Photobacterium leiognathi TaxID=553611 RepID=UPI002738B7E2|nr:family 20 glycosylhydrolase [Photobacterium leiognathi]